MALIDKIFGDKPAREEHDRQMRQMLNSVCERQQSSWAELRSSRSPTIRFLARVFG